MGFTHRKGGGKRRRATAAGDTTDGIEMTELSRQYAEQVFFAHDLVVPDEMYDPDSPHQPFASQAARNALVRKLLGEKEVYANALREISNANGTLYAAMSHCTMSSSDFDRSRRMAADRLNARETAQADLDAQTRRDMRLEMLLSTALRCRNQSIPPFCTVCLSLRCLKAAVPHSAWDMLQLGRIIFSREWTDGLAMEVGRHLSEWPTETSSKSIGFAVADNCAYQIKLTFEHADKDGEFLQTVNWLSVPLTAPDDGPIPEIRGRCARAFIRDRRTLTASS